MSSQQWRGDGEGGNDRGAGGAACVGNAGGGHRPRGYHGCVGGAGEPSEQPGRVAVIFSPSLYAVGRTGGTIMLVFDRDDTLMHKSRKATSSCLSTRYLKDIWGLVQITMFHGKKSNSCNLQ